MKVTETLKSLWKEKNVDVAAKICMYKSAATHSALYGKGKTEGRCEGNKNV